MAIYRGRRPGANFTIVSNAVLRDDRLSYRARGILAVILSHREDWSTNSEALARAGKEGRDAIRTALAELEEAGYLVREKRRGADGRYATQQVVYDEPQELLETDLFGLPTAPAPGNPALDNPAEVSQAPIEDHQEDPSPNGEGHLSLVEAQTEAKPDRATFVKAATGETMGMARTRSVTVFPGKVKAVAGALFSGAPQTEPDHFAKAYVALRMKGKTPNAEMVADEIAGHVRGYKNTHHDHWASGGEF